MRGLLAGSLLVAGCFNPPPPPPDGRPDGPPADVPIGGDGFDAPNEELGPWGPVTAALLPALSDDDPTLTADLLELYFNRASDIYVAKRASTTDPFGTPTLVTELSSSFAETTPEITSDGLTIYLASRRTPTLGMEDIWMATRASRTAAWDAPVHVTELSSSDFDGAATPTGDNITIVLYSSRSGTLEIYETNRGSPSVPWPTPSVHGELTSGIGDYDPMLSLDRSTVYYDSAASGGGDLFTARRSSFASTFGEPQAITELNTALYLEEDPWVSPDGHHIFFASNRDGMEGIYESSR